MAVGSAITPGTTPSGAKPRRRRFQFSLRTALLWMFLASILFAGFAWRRNRAERQRQTVEELRERGAGVEYRYFSFWKPKNGVIVQTDEEFFSSAPGCGAAWETILCMT